MNPLFESYQYIPFDKIKPEHVEPVVEKILQQNREQLKQLLSQNQTYTWDNLIAPLEEDDDRLHHIWSPVVHLNSVMNNDEFRSVYESCVEKVTTYYTEVGQNKKLYRAYLQIAQSDAFAMYTTAQKKVINDALREFKLSGVSLDDDKKDRFQKLQMQLAKLTTQFANNVLDATDFWTYLVKDRNQLKGIPEHVIVKAARFAEEKNQSGWLLDLHAPCYLPVMTYADDRELRKTIYDAYITRASDQGVMITGNQKAGDWDNSQVMLDILDCRHQLAILLGFPNYAEYSLVSKMAQSAQQVIDFLVDLADKSLAHAKQEFAQLNFFAQQEYGVTELQPWDMAYYSEKLQQHKYAVSSEELRSYFPIDRVLSGLFIVIEKLYGVKIKERLEFNSWHESVRFFDLIDADNKIQAQFYLDLYARQGKRGGAWMDDCQVRRKKSDDTLQIPIAHIVCNFSTGSDHKPSLLTHDEVETLFHEFGHGLHHMLTKIEYASVSGINGVPWDAVELPSQFFENWVWQSEVLTLISRHFETAETIPEVIIKRLFNAKNFQSGMQMLRQIEFSLFDMRIHSEFQSRETFSLQAVLDEVRDNYSVIPIVDYNRFQHGFSHIFAGGYAAGYYSYKWAEVLASDAFDKFSENGIFNKTTGQEFLHTILEKGGSEEPLDLFMKFRGREPNTDALLKQSGLVEE